ncbi:LLM class flavin-dependent oxidoreductase [Streptomyces sp. PSKA30]|uniref:LLM class flavin-dependent oxidoreductase n=1 Tax=Streptomyces sp. PSKA30 TaxID=2874597 RepID=UPI001CD0A39A|nr:LLM class flavin-dependent oxidoreductase [Streptomyces sp. PSKA30]MBZ9641612.1 LLM class flavin-dependent oxidoreductase [Streptomyces sp. PSKA30]
MENGMFADNGFKLGLFAPNASSGLAITTIPERWSGNWADNRALAVLADRLGIDFLLPVGRWIGWPGTTFHDSVLETITWAGGMLAVTEHISVFATVHSALLPPVVAAKQLATVDRIGDGRAGLNIVAGWYQAEYEAFGLDLPGSPAQRYAHAQEWWDVVRTLWSSEEPFDHDGEFFPGLTGLHTSPRPVAGRLPVINAAVSEAGRGFATRNADFLLTAAFDPQRGSALVDGVERAAAQHGGRRVTVMSNAYVVCRPTRSEAEEFLRYYAEENADWQGVDTVMGGQGINPQSFSEAQIRMFRPRFAAGHGGLPLVGSPDDIAATIVSFARAGLGGLALSFVDYLGELEFFASEVIPRLEKAGIRRPVGG